VTFSVGLPVEINNPAPVSQAWFQQFVSLNAFAAAL